MGSRRTDRTSGSRRRTAAWAAACQSLLLIVLAAAWPGVASALSGPSQPTAATAHGAYRALCPPAAPGFMACLAEVRTDIPLRPMAAVGSSFVPSGYGPSQLRAAYGLPAPSAGNGTGALIAIVDSSDLPTAASDLAVYRSQFGLSPCTTANGCFTKVDQRGGTSYPAADSDWSGEIALDIEMVSAVCPNCKILLVEADTASVFNLGTAVNLAVSRGAIAVSNSYGGQDSGQTADDSAYFNHPGVAVTASSGDSGYGVQFPASSPHVVAVGGTTLNTSGSPRGWTESAWSGAGSGCSGGAAKPSWQVDPSCSNRTMTDVSVIGDPSTGVAMYQGSWFVAGGTSVGSPMIAGIFGLAGAPKAGSYPASYLYSQSSLLNDVTSGSNGSCGGSYLCTAGVGYDGPTGLGTPNGIGAFISPALPGAPNTVSGVGGNTTVAVSWHAAAANGHPITGYTATASPGGNTCTTTGTLTCTVNGLINGTSYTFRVTATNSVGTGPASAASAGVIPASVPGAPTGVSATPADGSAVVSWTAPASTGGMPITGYAVTSAPGGKTCTTSGALTCTVLGLTNGTSYTFSVTATNVKGTGPASSASSSVTPTPIPGATYIPVVPNRLIDSRVSGDQLTKLVAGHAQTFTVTNESLDSTKNIPADAVAVTGNLTVTAQSAPGYFALTQAPQAAPSTSTLNFPLGDDRANGVTVPLATNGSTGTLSITYVSKTAGATAQVVFDVTGYFTKLDPGGQGATYIPVVPNRLIDSRVSGDQLTKLVAGHAQTFTVTNESLDSTKNIPADAVAVTGNLTVTAQSAPGYFALTQTPQAAPSTSTLNFPLGDDRANGVTVPLATNGSTGTLSITYVSKTAGATAQVVFDVTGYFTKLDPGGQGATYIPVVPNRLIDSRVSGDQLTKLVAGHAQTFTVTNESLDSTKNIPADAVAVTGNLTVTAQSAPGYFALTQAPQAAPSTSTLNFPLGDDRANGVTVPLATNGSTGTLSITYVSKTAGATAQVVFDVTGYFVPPG